MTKPTMQDIYHLDLPLLKPVKDDTREQKLAKHESRAALIRALEQAHMGGATPSIVILYEKDPTSPGRVALEDYLPLPGLSDDTHMGDIVSVHKSAKGNIYFKMRDTSRADGVSSWSWTCIRPERVKVCQYRGAQVDTRPIGRLSASSRADDSTEPDAVTAGAAETGNAK